MLYPKLNRNGAPDRIRTCGPQIRNLMLYPTELRALGDAGLAILVGACQNQFLALGGKTGRGSGSAGMPSSTKSATSCCEAVP